MTLLDKIRRHSLATYFLLTFAISWSAFLLVVVPTVGIPAPEEAFSTTAAAFAAGIFALLLGPPVASLLLTGLVSGRAGYRDLVRRAARVRVAPRFYAMTLLAPASFLAILALLSRADRDYLPGFLSAPLPAILAAIAYAISAGLFEELGWTGFATPRLIARFGGIRGALVLGVVWTVWHILPVFTFSWASMGMLYAASLAQSFVFLGSFRIVMTLVYERTGSLFMAMLLHTTLTASSILVSPVTSPEKALVWNSLWPLSLAAFAAAFALFRVIPESPDGRSASSSA